MKLTDPDARLYASVHKLLAEYTLGTILDAVWDAEKIQREQPEIAERILAEKEPIPISARRRAGRSNVK